MQWSCPNLRLVNVFTRRRCCGPFPSNHPHSLRDTCPSERLGDRPQTRDAKGNDGGQGQVRTPCRAARPDNRSHRAGDRPDHVLVAQEPPRRQRASGLGASRFVRRFQHQLGGCVVRDSGRFQPGSGPRSTLQSTSPVADDRPRASALATGMPPRPASPCPRRMGRMLQRHVTAIAPTMMMDRSHPGPQPGFGQKNEAESTTPRAGLAGLRPRAPWGDLSRVHRAQGWPARVGRSAMDPIMTVMPIGHRSNAGRRATDQRESPSTQASAEGAAASESGERRRQATAARRRARRA